MRSRILTIALLIASFQASADDEWDYAMPHKNRCSEGGQQVMNRCLAAEYEKVDKRMNEAYQQLLHSLENGEKLRSAQRAWLSFRDLTCEYDNSGIGKNGSLYSYADSACRIDLTEKRIRDLQQYVEWNCNGCPPRK